MDTGFLILVLLLSLFFLPVPVIYYIFEKNGRKDIRKVILLTALLYAAMMYLIVQGLANDQESWLAKNSERQRYPSYPNGKFANRLIRNGQIHNHAQLNHSYLPSNQRPLPSSVLRLPTLHPASLNLSILQSLLATFRPLPTSDFRLCTLHPTPKNSTLLLYFVLSNSSNFTLFFFNCFNLKNVFFLHICIKVKFEVMHILRMNSSS